MDPANDRVKSQSSQTIPFAGSMPEEAFIIPRIVKLLALQDSTG